MRGEEHGGDTSHPLPVLDAASAGRLYGHDDNGRAHQPGGLGQLHVNHLAGLKRSIWEACAVGLQAQELQVRDDSRVTLGNLNT